MKYHKSQQLKNDNRVSVLNKFDCGYNYNNINYPTTIDNIKTFEINNNESVFVYTITS